MNYSELKEQINKNDIANVYLFEGEEEYLQDFGTALIKSKVIANDEFDVHMIEGDQCVEKIDSIIDTFPLFNKNKFIVVRNSGFFSIAGNSRAEALTEKINNMGGSTYIIFRELNADKKSLFYLGISKICRTLLCGRQNDIELIKWAIKIFKSRGYTIGYDTAREFVEMSDRKMNSIMSEINKVLLYKEDDKTIKGSDIGLITTKSINDTIYNLTDAVSKRNRDAAILMLDEMINLREAEQKILYLITSNFINMIKVYKARKMNKSNQEIVKLTGVKYEWQVRKLLEFSRKFSENDLARIIDCCVSADAKIKSGLYEPRLSLEVLILQIVS